jgi:hypothetical protein
MRRRRAVPLAFLTHREAKRVLCSARRTINQLMTFKTPLRLVAKMQKQNVCVQNTTENIDLATTVYNVVELASIFGQHAVQIVSCDI